jgi:hypothetical protein
MTDNTSTTVEPQTCRPLPSGRSVVIRQSGAQDEIEVRSPAGEVEVRIVLTDSGPVVSLRAARLELESMDEVSLRCRRLSLQASETAELQSGGSVQVEALGEVRLQASEEMHLNGKIINLNC